MLQAIAGHDPKDPASADRPVPDYRAALTGSIEGLRIGVLRHLFEEDTSIPPRQRRRSKQRSTCCAGLARLSRTPASDQHRSTTT